MAKFQKGHSGNPSGRPKGSTNKTTEQIREAYQKIVSERIEQLQIDLDNMSPTNRWNILLGIQKTFMPTLTKSDIEGSVNGQLKIKVIWEDADRSQDS